MATWLACLARPSARSALLSARTTRSHMSHSWACSAAISAIGSEPFLSSVVASLVASVGTSVGTFVGLASAAVPSSALRTSATASTTPSPAATASATPSPAATASTTPSPAATASATLSPATTAIGLVLVSVARELLASSCSTSSGAPRQCSFACASPESGLLCAPASRLLSGSVGGVCMV